MDHTDLSRLRVKLFADGADLAGIAEMAKNPRIRGFTTNPTLMRKAGVSDYRAFSLEALAIVPDLPISFEVFADDFPTMERQALEIASWGSNVYVKIPITTTRGESSVGLIRRLSDRKVKLNVTALMTLAQVEATLPALAGGPGGFVSVFAGRIADTGRDPLPIMRASVEKLRAHPQLELIWASPREVLNVAHADSVGCHVITATNDILKKLSLWGKDLDGFSLETVRMFHDDGQAAGFTL